MTVVIDLNGRTGHLGSKWSTVVSYTTGREALTPGGQLEQRSQGHLQGRGQGQGSGFYQGRQEARCPSALGKRASVGPPRA